MKPTTAVRSLIHLYLPAVGMLALVSLPSLAASAQCEAQSSGERIAVLELYTSEGCDSCPPAERWLSALPARGFMANRVIPMAFHVDYWDQLGWPDPLAKAQFSARQRLRAQRNRDRVVYTPQLLLNGADFQPTLADGHFEERLNELNRLPAAAHLFLRQRTTPSDVKIELDMRLLQVDRRDVQTYIAITENRLQSAVSAGENRGKLLHHDFVVRELAGPLPTDASGRVHWKSTMAVHPDWKRPDLSLVTFVQDERSGDILQALLSPICGR
jgi:hypothetical protein